MQADRGCKPGRPCELMYRRCHGRCCRRGGPPTQRVASPGGGSGQMGGGGLPDMTGITLSRDGGALGLFRWVNVYLIRVISLSPFSCSVAVQVCQHLQSQQTEQGWSVCDGLRRAKRSHSVFSRRPAQPRTVSTAEADGHHHNFCHLLHSVRAGKKTSICAVTSQIALADQLGVLMFLQKRCKESQNTCLLRVVIFCLLCFFSVGEESGEKEVSMRRKLHHFWLR